MQYISLRHDVTRYFYDTEFMESGYGQPIELISIGIVCEDGRELYLVNSDADLSKANDWVKANVIPQLPHQFAHPHIWKSHASIRDAVREFLREGRPELWGYFTDYDHVMYSQLFGRMIDLPAYMPKFSMDLKQYAEMIGVKRQEFPEQTKGLHDALEDARWNREVFDFLRRM